MRQHPTQCRKPAPAAAAAPTQTWKELFPQFKVAGQSGFVSTEEFLLWLDRAEKGEAPKQQRHFLGVAGSIASGGFTLKGVALPLVLLLTFIGGITLNLTPCVLPLIPVNLAIIGAGVKAGSRMKGFLLGGMYGLGTALLYGVLGLVAVLGAAKSGSLNAQWWFNAGITVVFIVLALAMFDFILIDFTKYQSKLGIKKESGNYLFAFIMGAVNALLAGACVAPVVIAVVLTRKMPTRTARPSRWHYPSCSASAWPCRGRSRARALHLCQSPVCGLCA